MTLAQRQRANQRARLIRSSIASCVRLGLDTTAAQLSYSVQLAAGPSISASDVDRAVAVWWRANRGRP